MNEPIDSYLDSLFEQARIEPLPISSKEIGSNLALTKGLASSRFYTTKWAFLFVGIMGLAVLFFFYPKSNSSTTKSLVVVSEPTLQNTTKTKGNSLPLIDSQIKPYIKHQNRSGSAISNLANSAPNVPSLFSQTFVAPTPIDYKPDLELSFQELAKLHIYTNGCELKYTNLRDSIYTNRSVLRKRESRIHYYTEIQSSGGSYTLSNSVLASDSMMKVLSDSFLPAYPMFIEKEITFLEKKSPSQNVGDVTTDILELKAPFFVAQDFIEEAKRMLVPIRVKLKAKANMYGRTDYDLIFWFKPNTNFCEMLPPTSANWVRQNYVDFTDKKYDELVQRMCERKLQREENLRKDSVLYAKDLSSALVLSNKQLKQLGFKKNKNGDIQYKVCYKKKLIEVYRLESQFPPSFNFIGGYGFMGFLKGINTSVPAHFITDEGTHFYQLTKERNIHSLERYDENFLYRQNFKEEKDKLIPVLISCKRKDGKIVKWYFWFSKTDAFYETIQQKKEN